ncbi:MAG: ATP-binding protein [Candidatus Brocadiaceae bacterium]|nr:ATP-binding protein [Candidatus Brocadiaceae bacterium]
MHNHLEQLQQLCLITSEFTKKMGSSPLLFRKITDGATSLFKGSKALVYLVRWGPTPQVVASRGLGHEFIEKLFRPGHETSPYELVHTKKCPIYLSIASKERDSSRDEIQTFLKGEGLEAMLSVPIKGDGETLGCICLFFNRDFPPKSYHLRIIEMFANEVAIAINNAQLYRRLRESEELYRELYDRAPCMYYSMSKDGIVLKCNNTGAEYLGHRKEELVGRSFLDLVEKGSVPLARAILESTLKEGHSEGELGLVTRDGNNLHTTIKATLSGLPGGKEIRVVLTDITEKKKLYEGLGRTEKLVAVGQLASGIAHDLNNFLTVILGVVHRMKEETPYNKGIKKGLDIIRKAAMDGAETARRIREFANIRVDTAKLVPLEINRIIMDVMNYTKPRLETIAHGKGVTYHIKLTRTLKGAWVLGNPSELKEVFVNIVNNALDAMPAGGTLTIEIYREGEGLAVSVKDTGVGMSEEVRKRVFDPFFTTKGASGSGLGMSVAYGIITRHRGEIKIDSQEGVGTNVIVRLPSTRKN